MLPDSIFQETESGIRIVRHSAESVEKNLALDEEFARDAGQSGRKTLRLWWGGPTAVVLGCSDKPERAVNADVCKRLSVPVLKRVSGGGAVVQSHGVLNYTLTMPDPVRLDIHRVFGLGTRMIINALARLGIEGRQQGISDVAIGDRKISGNAQARKWKSVLLHGSILVDMDCDMLEAVLRHPDREPGYRNGRPHRDFIVTLRDLGVEASFAEIEHIVIEAGRNLL